MKNKTFFKFFIIFILAILFRLWFIDKPEGLWNDEYVGWYIASKESFSEFLTMISRNCHTPLYYVFLKFWLSVFPDTDISLRMSSVIMSLLTIIVMFFTGKELKDTKTGLFCALFCALSSFYIYFAQEVRLYSLLSFISALIVYICIRLLREGKKRWFLIFIILNSLLCAVHTLGLIFSFFIILYSFIYLYKNFDEWKKIKQNCTETLQYIFPFFCVLLLISPFVFSIVFSKSLSQFWGDFSYTKIIFSFTDYFSPIQYNITNSPNTFRSILFQDDEINFSYIVFGLIPSIMASFAILKGFMQKDKILNLMIYASISFFAVCTVLSAMGKLILLTKYTCEIYPILILAFTTGVLSIKKEFIKKSFIAVYFLLTLLYLYYSPFSAPKMTRPEGNNIPVVLIEQAGLTKGDFIIFTYYDEDKFERYLKNKKIYNISSISKFNFNKPAFNNSSYHDTIKNGKTLYRNNFKEFPNKNIINFADFMVKRHMQKGDKVGIIYLNEVSFMSNKTINEIVDDDNQYKKTSFVFLTFSMIKNNLMYAFKQDDFKLNSITQSGNWTLIVYEKVL